MNGMLIKARKFMTVLLMAALLVANFGYSEANSYYTKQDTVVALDAGHYIGEPGKRSPYDDFFKYQKHEIEYNMGIVRAVEKKLKEKRPDIKIYLTNPNADNKTKSQRAVNAANHYADIIVSVHMNAIGDEWQEKISGCCVCVNRNSSTKVKGMAQDFIDDYSEQTGIKKVATNGIYERGSEVGLLDKATQLGIPAVLLECDFMDNYQAYRNFSDPTYLDMVAEVITENIINIVDKGV